MKRSAAVSGADLSIANPIVQNYKYDSLNRLTEAEEKDDVASNAGRN
ncbi:MAG: hypothetical protein IPN69_23320 [Acidobacteria bacterium]|nr:hypothetical protein [Acidobacteriota bacterium]